VIRVEVEAHLACASGHQHARPLLSTLPRLLFAVQKPLENRFSEEPITLQPTHRARQNLNRVPEAGLPENAVSNLNDLLWPPHKYNDPRAVLRKLARLIDNAFLNRLPIARVMHRDPLVRLIPPYNRVLLGSPLKVARFKLEAVRAVSAPSGRHAHHAHRQALPALEPAAITDLLNQVLEWLRKVRLVQDQQRILPKHAGVEWPGLIR